MRDNGLTAQSAASREPRRTPALVWLTALCAVGMLIALSAWLLRAGPGPLAAGAAAARLSLTETAVLRSLPGPVRALACSPDGRRLAVATDRGVSLYRIGTLDLSAELQTPAPVRCLAFAPDGWDLAAGADDGAVYRWECSTRIRLRTFQGSAHPVLSLAFSPDGRTLAAGSSDGTVRLWSESDGQATLMLQHGEGVTGLGFGSDGATLVSASDGAVRRWGVADGRALGTVGGTAPLAFSADRTLVACASGDRVRLWRTADGQPVLTLRVPGLRALTFVEPGMLATVTGDALQLRRVGDGRLLAAAPISGVGLRALVANSDSMLAGALAEGLQVWRVEGEGVPHLPTETLPRPTSTPAPTVTPRPSSTPRPTATPIPPPPPGILITPENAAQLQKVARWGKGSIRWLAYSPDGRQLAVVSSLGLRLYDTATYSETAVLEERVPVNSFAFSPDGRQLAVAASLGVRVYDTATYGERAAFEDGVPVSSAALSPDGALLAATAGDEIRLWRLADRRLLRTLAAQTGEVLRVAFSPGGSTLVSSSRGGVLRLWRVADGQVVREVQAQEGIRSFAFSPRGDLLAVASGDDTIHLLRAADGGLVRGLDAAVAGAACQVTFSPDGAYVAGVGAAGLGLWRVSDGTLVEGREQYGDALAIAFSPDGEFLVEVLPLAGVYTIRTADGADLHSFPVGACVLGVAISPDGGVLAVGSDDGTVSFRSLPKGRLLHQLGGWRRRSDLVTCLTFTADGAVLAAGSASVYLTDVALWCPADGHLLSTLEVDARSVNDIEYSGDGRTIAVEVRGGHIQIWKQEGGKVQRWSRGPGGEILDMDISPHGAILAASVYEDRTTVLWDIDRQEVLRVLPTGFVRSLAFSPDGCTLATASDGVLRLWRVGEAAAPTPLSWQWAAGGERPAREVISPATAGRVGEIAHLGQSVLYWIGYSPDGRFIAATSPEGIFLFDAETLAVVHFLPTDEMARDVALSPDGALLLARVGSEILFWHTADAKLVAKLDCGAEHGKPMALSPDGSTLVLGEGETLSVWRVPGPPPAIPPRAPVPSPATTPPIQPGNVSALTCAVRWDGGGPYDVVYSPDGRVFAVASDGGLALYDAASLEALRSLSGDAYEEAAFIRDGAFLVGVARPSVSLWETGNWRQVRSLDACGGCVDRFTFAPSRGLLAAACFEGSACLWEAASGRLLQCIEGPEWDTPRLAFAPDGKLLAVARRDGLVRLLSVPGAELVRTLDTMNTVEYPRLRWYELLFSPDGTMVAASGWYSSGAGIANVWRVADGALLRSIAPERGDVDDTGFSPDSRLLWWSDGRGLHVARVSDGQVIYTQDETHAVFSPDGSLLACWSWSGNDGIRLYRTADGCSLAELSGHRSSIVGVVFSPDSRYLASWSSDGTARLWAVR